MVNGEKFQSHTVTLTVQSRSKSHRDLDWTMPNVELVRAIFIYYNLFKFQVEPLFFELLCTQTPRQTDRHTDGHEYSIVAVENPQL